MKNSKNMPVIIAVLSFLFVSIAVFAIIWAIGEDNSVNPPEPENTTAGEVIFVTEPPRPVTDESGVTVTDSNGETVTEPPRIVTDSSGIPMTLAPSTASNTANTAPYSETASEPAVTASPVPPVFIDSIVLTDHTLNVYQAGDVIIFITDDEIPRHGSLGIDLQYEKDETITDVRATVLISQDFASFFPYHNRDEGKYVAGSIFRSTMPAGTEIFQFTITGTGNFNLSDKRGDFPGTFSIDFKF
jgi:hypothetical protein